MQARACPLVKADLKGGGIMPRVRTAPIPWKRRSRFLLVGSGVLFLSGYWLLTVSAQSVNSPTIVKIIAGGDPTPIGGVFASDGTPALALGQSSPGSLDSTVFYATVADKVGAR